MATELQTPYRAPALANAMSEAAQRFLASLNDSQRRAATFAFEGDERYVWNYRPVESMPRNGLWLIAMTADQQRAAYALMETGLSTRGAEQTCRIMAREATLREHERADQRIAAMVRDPELYWWSVFGNPGGTAPWGWRISGHHIGLHFTVVGDQIAPAPLFFGANPAESLFGPDKGDRILPEEEDRARDLLRRLDVPSKALAHYSPIAPRDILTDVHRRVYPGVVHRGLSFARMDAASGDRLTDLIRHYLGRASDTLANDAWQRVRSASLDDVTFAWAGPEGRGEGHYYAIHGPTFLIEYDNTQNGANHIHSVWREWEGDWGEDILAAHYRGPHANGHPH